MLLCVQPTRRGKAALRQSTKKVCTERDRIREGEKVREREREREKERETSDGDANATTSSVTAAHLERVVTLQRVLSGSDSTHNRVAI
jgi:hypothetical protein